jgi:hypothetical protein
MVFIGKDASIILLKGSGKKNQVGKNRVETAAWLSKKL